MSKHQAKKLFARCGDDRYTIPGHDYTIGLEELIRLEDLEVRFEPGGGFGASLEFALEATRAAWEYRLDEALQLGIEEVVILDHLDCGAFGIAFGDLSSEAEEAKHLETIETAKKMVTAKGLRFTAYLQDGRSLRKVA